MREVFHQSLEDVQGRLVEIAELVTVAIDKATRAFSSSDVALAEEVIEAEFAALAHALPQLTAMVASEVHDHNEDPLGWCDSQNEFEFTLDLLLDGLARAAEG